MTTETTTTTTAADAGATDTAAATDTIATTTTDTTTDTKAADAAASTDSATTETTTDAKADDKAAAKKASDDEDLLFKEDKKEGDESKTDDKKEGEDTDKDKPAKTFEVEKLTIPEEYTIPDDIKAELDTVANELKLDQEGTQKLVDLHLKMLDKNIDAWLDTKKSWRDESKADPVYGGAKLAESVDNCNEIVRKFGDETFKDDIKMLGMGNKLSFIKFLNKVYAATKNDTAGDIKGGASEEKKDAASVLYPGMK